jgi:hypothetical protein
MILHRSHGGERRVWRATRLGPCLFFLLVTLRFEFRELVWSQDAFDVFHELRLTRFRAPGFVVLGHRRFHLCLLICRQVETRKRGHTGHLAFVPRLLRAIAVFTREHRSRCEYTRHH